MLIKKELDNIHAGENIFVCTTYNVGIFGALLRKGEIVDSDGNVQRYISMRISEDNYEDIYERQITNIFVYPVEDKLEYWQEFEEKYSMKCFDDEGNLRNISVIINEMLINEIWDELAEREKEEFIENLPSDDKTMLDLINALNMSRNRNNELGKKMAEMADDRIKTCNAVIDFKEKYNSISNSFPEYKWAYDFLYRYLGIDKLLKAV